MNLAKCELLHVSKMTGKIKLAELTSEPAFPFLYLQVIAVNIIKTIHFLVNYCVTKRYIRPQNTSR